MTLDSLNQKTLILDRAGLGMKPFWDNAICNIVDLEAIAKSQPNGMFIVRAAIEGYTQREIGQHLGRHHSAIQRILKRCFIGSRLGCA